MNIPGYIIERELGHGGMSTVYLAEQESLGRKVALKVMAPALAADRNFGERFLHEGRTVAQLVHQNILSVYDIGVVDHSYYMAMEHVPGGDLKQRIRHGALPAAQVLEILRQVAAALGYAHAKGFVHRDVKPENILFREDGTAVLADFGIAKAVGSGSKMTGTGMTIGTAHYMSPEQAQGKTIDGRADLYSLGVVLYEMLVGLVPYDAESTVAIAVQHMQGPLPELPAGLSGYQPLLHRMMAKDPVARFSAAGELVAAIDWLRSGQTVQTPVPSTTVVSEPVNRPVKATQVMSQAVPISDTPKCTTGGGLKWAIGGVVLALLLVGCIWLSQQRSQPSFVDAGSGAASNAASGMQNVQQPEVLSIPNEMTPRQRIEQLLAEAQRDLREQRLTSPAGNNALERYRKVLAIDPSNKEAQDGLAAIADRYLGTGDEQNSDDRSAQAGGSLDSESLTPPDTAGLEEQPSGLDRLQ